MKANPGTLSGQTGGFDDPSNGDHVPLTALAGVGDRRVDVRDTTTTKEYLDVQALLSKAAFTRGTPVRSTAVAASPNGSRKLQVKDNADARLVFQTDPEGMAAEQYRLLRRRIRTEFPQGGTLLITSPCPGDGKTLTAANLSWCLAEGTPTLLIEADLRRPSLAKLFGCTPASGVQGAFKGEIDPEETVASVSGIPLYVAMVTKAQADPACVVTQGGVKHFLEWARARFKWVLVDAPPVLPAADALELSALVDAAFLVLRARSSHRELVERSLAALGDRLRGVILNDATNCLDPYYRRYLPKYGRYYTNTK